MSVLVHCMDTRLFVLGFESSYGVEIRMSAVFLLFLGSTV
jgi:hypothetical protein